MDEPFGALDVQTKAIMQTELLGLWEQLRPSVLFITHDLDEAVALADRVLIMTSGPGSIKQSLRHRPAPPARRGAGDPPRAALPRAAGTRSGRRCSDEVERAYAADGRCGMSAVRDTWAEAPRRRREACASGRACAHVAGVRRACGWAARAGARPCLIGGWQLFTEQGWVDKFFFGQPSGIWHALVTLFTKGTAFGSIWLNMWVTIKEAVYGFLLGTGAGIVLGLLLGQNRFLADVFGPYIKIVNSIPRIILGSIFVVAFGLGTFPKMLLAAVLVFFVVFFNAFQGVREVDPNLVANIRVLGASPLQVARHVTIPSALTWIIASLHTAFGFAIIGALVGRGARGPARHRADHHARPRASSTRTRSSPGW